MYLEFGWDLLLNFSITILIALMWARISSGPDNFKRAIKYQTLQVPFYNGFETVANIAFSFETNFGWRIHLKLSDSSNN